ncbi:MAG TPA: exopolyphosphatase, partial [Actinomycetes bacterium]
MTRVAAIDCGTNSIRLLVADIDAGAGTLTDVDRRMRIVRLGQDVDRTGRLAPEALFRTFAACDEYAEVAS